MKFLQLCLVQSRSLFLEFGIAIETNENAFLTSDVFIPVHWKLAKPWVKFIQLWLVQVSIHNLSVLGSWKLKIFCHSPVEMIQSKQRTISAFDLTV